MEAAMTANKADMEYRRKVVYDYRMAYRACAKIENDLQRNVFQKAGNEGIIKMLQEQKEYWEAKFAEIAARVVAEGIDVNESFPWEPHDDTDLGCDWE